MLLRTGFRSIFGTGGRILQDVKSLQSVRTPVCSDDTGVNIVGHLIDGPEYQELHLELGVIFFGQSG